MTSATEIHGTLSGLAMAFRLHPPPCHVNRPGLRLRTGEQQRIEQVVGRHTQQRRRIGVQHHDHPAPQRLRPQPLPHEIAGHATMPERKFHRLLDLLGEV